MRVTVLAEHVHPTQEGLLLVSVEVMTTTQCKLLYSYMHAAIAHSGMSQYSQLYGVNSFSKYRLWTGTTGGGGVLYSGGIS